MRRWIALCEKIITLTFRPGGEIIGKGKFPVIDLSVWENPLRRELEAAIHKCFVMDGEPNLRGLAHGGKVWVWEAEKATHHDILQALGLSDGLDFDWQSPEFSFFMVYGSRWSDNSDRPIVVSYMWGSGALMASVAARWRAKIVHGGPWMTDATR